MPGTVHIKLSYARDPTGSGFFWPGSAQKRTEILSIKRNSPADFEAIYQGRPGQREGTIFLAADLDNFYNPPANIALGMADPEVRAFVAKGHGVYQAYDTAFSTSSQSAHTARVTALFIPCQSYHCGEDPETSGPCDFHFDVAILDVFRERLDWGGLVGAFRAGHTLWQPEQNIIEKKASGISLIQSMSANYPIIPVAASTGKRERAVNSVDLKHAGSVQGWFRQHRVLVPFNAPWLEGWRVEMKDFSGADDVSSDRVDATVHLVTHAIIMSANRAVLPTDWTPEKSTLPARVSEHARQINPLVSLDPRAQFLSILGQLPDLSEDPYYGTCARCINNTNGFCSVQQRKVIAMDSCGEFSSIDERVASPFGLQ